MLNDHQKEIEKIKKLPPHSFNTGGIIYRTAECFCSLDDFILR